MGFTIVELPPQRLAALRHIGPFQSIGATFDRLGAWAASHQESLRGAPLAVYIDDPETTPAESLRSDAAIPIAEDLQVPGVPGTGVPGVGESRLPGGRYAVATHHGPYSGLGPAWWRFMADLAAEGVALDQTRPCFEVYQSDPSHTPEAELITVLHQPVA